MSAFIKHASIFILVIFFHLKHGHCEDQKMIDSLEILELLSELALLRHHPQSVYSNQDNMTEGFTSLLDHLENQNLTNDNGNINCSSLTQHSLLPKNLCNDGKLFTCMSANDMLKLVPQSTKSVSEALARLCPLLLLQLHSTACTNSSAEVVNTKPSSTAVWGYGLLFVTIISCCSLVGIIILPLLSKNVYQIVLMLFEGLAVGSLVGSSLFHLIPQTFKLVGQDKEHNYLWRSLLIFGGIYLFYISERFMKIIIDIKQSKKSKKASYNGNASSDLLKSLPEINPVVGKLDECEKAKDSNGSLQIIHTESRSHQNNYKPIDSEANKNNSALAFSLENEASHHHEHFEKETTTIATVAWMIIFGDGLHNFIDGLSIGAAFSESILAGISISVAVICEEFPHELGDFAVLLGAGMTMKQALLYNFLSAITCYLGLVMGILLGDLAEGSVYIFALAAGMFLYISLVDMMGELSESLEAARHKGLKEELRVFFIQNMGIALGVAILFVMARYAEHFNFDNLSSITSNSEELLDDRVKAIYTGFQEAKSLHGALVN